VSLSVDRCPNCGASAHGPNMVCQYCGSHLHDPKKQAKPPLEPKPVPEARATPEKIVRKPAPAPKSIWKRETSGVGVLVLVVVVLVIGYIYWSTLFRNPHGGLTPRTLSASTQKHRSPDGTVPPGSENPFALPPLFPTGAPLPFDPFQMDEAALERDISDHLPPGMSMSREPAKPAPRAEASEPPATQ